MTDFTTAPEYFDSRDVIERIEELDAEFEATVNTEIGPVTFVNLAGMDEETLDEYRALTGLRDAATAYVEDWVYGETFIREDEFTEYCEEKVKECGYLPSNLPEWIAIDWDETADNMKEDYHEFTFLGQTYLAR